MAKKISITIIGILVLLFTFWLGRMSDASTQVAASQVPAPKPQKQIRVDTSFSFPVMDSNGKEITKIQYLIQSADLQNQIIINGQTATAVKGRTFLILTVKITNSSNQNIVLNARDYVRLTENDTPDLLAPDIHNDPVQVQAISTKVTRLGFPINSNDTKLTLHVGQISGKKTDIPLSLH